MTCVLGNFMRHDIIKFDGEGLDDAFGNVGSGKLLYVKLKTEIHKK